MADRISFTPGAVEVVALHIKAFDSSQDIIDLRSMCNTFNIYEDIYMHCMHAEVNINDSLNLYDDFPICGDEVVEIAYKTAGEQIPINVLFRVYKVGDRIPLNDKTMNYTLYCVSEEEIVDTATAVFESFKNESGTDIIQKIFKGYLKNASKDLDTGMNNVQDGGGVNDTLYPNGKHIENIEETKGLYSYIGHGETAFTTIDKISGELENISTDSSCTWMFWENFDGFNFETIERMASRGSEEEYVYVMKNRNQDDRNADYNEYQKINDLVIEPMYDSLDSMLDGGMGSKVKYVDPVTKTFSTISYNYGKAHKKENHIEEFPLKNKDFLERYTFEDIKSNIMWSDFNQSQCKYIRSKLPNKQDFRRKQNYYAKKLAWMKNFEGVKVRFSLPGDSEVKTGQCIDLNIPAASGLGKHLKSGADHTYVNGKFIIMSIRHEVSVSDSKYVTYIEAAKDGFINLIKPTIE